MSSVITTKVHSVLANNQDLTKEEKDKLYYSLDIIINTIVKTLLTFIVFLVLGEPISFIDILLVVMLTRTYNGGLHFNTFWGCTLFTTFYFLLIQFSSNAIILSDINIYGIYIISLMILIIFAPVISNKRPKYSKNKLLQFKIVSLIIITMYFILYSFMGINKFIQLSFLGIFFNNIQLLIGKGVEIIEKHKIIIKSK